MNSQSGAEPRLMNPMPYASIPRIQKLIEELNNIKASQSKEQDNEKHLKQLLYIEQECEKQFLLIKDLAIKFKITHALVKEYEQAINRFIALRIQSVQ